MGRGGGEGVGEKQGRVSGEGVGRGRSESRDVWTGRRCRIWWRSGQKWKEEW